MSRDLTTGKYNLNDMNRVCVCGHRLGKHAAINDSNKRPCFYGDEPEDATDLDCKCEDFRK